MLWWAPKNCDEEETILVLTSRLPAFGERRIIGTSRADLLSEKNRTGKLLTLVSPQGIPGDASRAEIPEGVN